MLVEALKTVRVALEEAMGSSWTPEELCESQSVEAGKEEWTFRCEEALAVVKQLLEGPQPPSAKAAGELARKWLAHPVLSASALHEGFEKLARAATAS